MKIVVIDGQGGRLGGLLHNPNALGIFLAVGWFAITACLEEGGEEDALSRVLRHLEPLVLAALALTLSMGSFVAMAAGILVLLLEKKRRASWREESVGTPKSARMSSRRWGAVRTVEPVSFSLSSRVWLMRGEEEAAVSSVLDHFRSAR